MTNPLEEMELSAAQGHLLGLLHRAGEPLCPRDIEHSLQLSHPTVSGLLSRLEQKGFVELRTDEADHRCKRIYLLPKSDQCHRRIHDVLMENEQTMTRDFTPEEQKQFAALLRRAIDNLGGSPLPKQGGH